MLVVQEGVSGRTATCIFSVSSMCCEDVSDLEVSGRTPSLSVGILHLAVRTRSFYEILGVFTGVEHEYFPERACP